MSNHRLIVCGLLIGCMAVSLSACVATVPLAPSFTVLPKQGEALDVFQKHDIYCRSYASSAGGESSAQQAQSKQVASAAAGAGLGAAAGALLGSPGGHAGSGAAIGAGTGLLFGAVVGQKRAQQSMALAQQRYDGAYAQCMSAYGERLPLPVQPPQRAIYVAPSPPVVIYPVYPAG